MGKNNKKNKSKEMSNKVAKTSKNNEANSTDVKVPTENVTVDNVLVNVIPTENVPVEKTTMENVTVDNALVNVIPTENAPVEKTTTENVTVDNVLVNVIPTENAPVEKTTMENVSTNNATNTVTHVPTITPPNKAPPPTMNQRAVKSEDTPIEKPEEKSTEKPTEITTEKSTEPAKEKSTEITTEKSTEEKPIVKTADVQVPTSVTFDLHDMYRAVEDPTQWLGRSFYDKLAIKKEDHKVYSAGGIKDILDETVPYVISDHTTHFTKDGKYWLLQQNSFRCKTCREPFVNVMNQFVMYNRVNSFNSYIVNGWPIDASTLKVAIEEKNMKFLLTILERGVDPNEVTDTIVQSKHPWIIQHCIEHGLTLTTQLLMDVASTGNLVSAEYISGYVQLP